jgi:hypothetical protein
MKLRDMIYIMAPSYSGSTLLTRLLAQHPQIATIGELKATAMGGLSTYYCSCGTLLTECPFWQQVITAMAVHGKNFSLENFGTHFRTHSPIIDRLLRTSYHGPFLEAVREIAFQCYPSAARLRKTIIEQNKAVIETICSIQQKNIFLDDSKDPVRLKFLLSSDYWYIRVIYLIRDGRGVTNSYMRHHNAHMTEAATEWVHTQQECDRMAKQLGSDLCLQICYEDLCRNPDEILTKITTFLDIAPVTDNRQSLSVQQQHILGNQMRLTALHDIRLDEKWKKSLSSDDLTIFNAIGGKLNQSYGYC